MPSRDQLDRRIRVYRWLRYFPLTLLMIVLVSSCLLPMSDNVRLLLVGAAISLFLLGIFLAWLIGVRCPICEQNLARIVEASATRSIRFCPKCATGFENQTRRVHEYPLEVGADEHLDLKPVGRYASKDAKKLQAGADEHRESKPRHILGDAAIVARTIYAGLGIAILCSLFNQFGDSTVLSAIVFSSFLLSILIAVWIQIRGLRCPGCNSRLTRLILASINWRIYPSMTCCPFCGFDLTETRGGSSHTISDAR